MNNLSQAVVDPDKLRRSEQLQDAFQLFNELSRNLTESYHGLQQQVADLSKELAAARNARLKTLGEKEQLANHLHALLETLPGGVVVLDSSGNIIRLNRVAGELLGKPLLGAKWNDVVNRSLGEQSDTPRERRLANGRYVNLSIQPLGDDSGQVILLTDVSEVRVLQDLVNHQKRLSAMGEMVAALAHQIRTPLSAAMLHASNLGNPALEPARQQRYAAKLLERLRCLERQVNDMLIFARDGRLVMEQIPLPRLAAKISEAVESLVGDNAIQVRITNRIGPGEVCCNEDALIGAVLNLVTNAVQAMNNQGLIQLEIAQRGASIRLSVQDHGPGIPRAARERIFEPFFTTRANGTGLGLAAVENVVRSHRGRVWCDTQSGPGAEFHIELPLNQNEQLLPGGAYQRDGRLAGS
ncbi:MAG: sensor histidine kinase [Methylococcales bacterium]